MSGHDAVRRDELHSVSLRELEARVIAAGVLISRRQLMRHCQAGTFDAQKLPATNNIMEWFVAPASIEKGIADIKTLQTQRARRDATRPAVTSPVAPVIERNSNVDTTGHVATQPDMTEKEIQPSSTTTDSDMSRHVATNIDIFEHPYVKRLEKQIDKLEAKYEAQVRRTEEIQLRGQERLLELQRMTAVGQSQTLADFMLKAKSWLLGQGSEATSETLDGAATDLSPSQNEPTGNAVL